MLLKRPVDMSHRTICGAALLVALSATFGCGSRSTLRADEQAATPACVTDLDCDSACFVSRCEAGACVEVQPIVCDDDDPCTTDSCDPERSCVFTPRTPDADGDGHRAPLPGFLPGGPGACGDDCDDTSALARPGGVERCDGRDNDCDGIVDNDALYLTPQLPAPVRVGSAELSTSRGTGLAFGAGVFAASYGGRQDRTRSYLQGLDARGRSVFPEAPLTSVNVMSFGAALQWSGNAFGATWSDPRIDGNYEVYFALFDASGERLGPDVRVSDAPNFSIHPLVIHDSGRFVLVWDDRRDGGLGDQSAVYGQLVDNAGALVGPNRRLSELGLIAEYPRLAAGPRRLGLVYTVLDASGVRLLFQSFDKDLGAPATLVELESQDAIGPRITAVGERFVVTWMTYTDRPGPEVMGAVLGAEGEVLVEPRAIAAGAEFARTHNTVSLGDRFVLLWSDTLDGNYELYAATMDGELGVLEERTRLTFDDAESLAPVAALGENGSLGVLFDDWRGGSRHAYFTALGCAIP